MSWNIIEEFMFIVDFHFKAMYVATYGGMVCFSFFERVLMGPLSGFKIIVS